MTIASLVTFVALVAIVTGGNPFRYLWQAVQVVKRSPSLLWMFAGIGLVLAINGLQLKLEGLLTTWWHCRFTS